MSKFYICLPNSETVSHALCWNHFFEILKSDEPLRMTAPGRADRNSHATEVRAERGGGALGAKEEEGGKKGAKKGAG